MYNIIYWKPTLDFLDNDDPYADLCPVFYLTEDTFPEQALAQ